MAALNFHPWVHNAVGRYGKVVMRRQYGKVVLAMPPSQGQKPPNAAQVERRARFSQAAAYSKVVMAEPTRRAVYEPQAAQAQKPVFAMIMAEFIRRPLLQTVNLAAYHGAVGNVIDINTRNDLTASVDVIIRDENEVELESGGTVAHNGGWRFTAGIAIPVGTRVTVEVVVTDTSGLELKVRKNLVIA